MGREQTLKEKKYGTVIDPITVVSLPIEKPPVQTPQNFVKVGKGQNVFGIGGRNIDDPTTPEIERVYTPSPYKTQAQKDFSSFTQQTWSNIFGKNVFTDLAKSVQIPEPASPTGNGNGTSDKCQECNAWDVGCELSHMLAGTCTPTNGNGTCTTCDSDKCQECNAWDVPCELGHMASGTCTPPEPKPPCDLGCLMTFRGCDCGCKDVKPCTTCDSAICVECNAYDLQCEDCRTKDGTCTPPETPCGCLPFDIGCEIGCWWDKNKNYVYIIGGIIGLGILLWLLRPLFGIAKNVTGITKPAVTRGGYSTYVGLK